MQPSKIDQSRGVTLPPIAAPRPGHTQEAQ
jgi:hypothetical protein